MKKPAAAVLLILLGVLPLFGCGPETLVLYTDLASKDTAALIAPFTQKTGIQVDIVTFNNADQLVEAVSPQRGQSGQATPSATPIAKPADVVLSKSMIALPELAGREALDSYMPPEAADLPYGANGGGYWYGFGGRGWVIAWNTSLAKKQPAGYQDLADAAYPMKSVAMPDLQRYSFYPLAVYTLMGGDYTINLYRTILLNEVTFTGSPAEAAGCVAKGICQVGVTTYEAAKQRKDGGDPVDFVFPDQDANCMGAWVEFYSAGIAKGGKNLKAARQLDDWLLSIQAEALSVKMGLSDVTLRDTGCGAPVVIPLKVDPGVAYASGRAAENAFSRLAGEFGQ